MVAVEVNENSNDWRRVGQRSRKGTAAANANAAATTQTVTATGPSGPCGLLIINAVDDARARVAVKISVRQIPCCSRSCR